MKNGKAQLLTDRLMIREFEPWDFKAVHEYAIDREVYRFMPWGPNTPKKTRDYIKEAMLYSMARPRKHYHMAVCLQDSGVLIGGCHISVEDRISRTGHIGYVLNRKYWGNGYGTEIAKGLLKFGFTKLKLHRIIATCDVLNKRSAHVLEKAGMQLEGRLREDMIVRGRWRNSFMYSILEGEVTGKF